MPSKDQIAVNVVTPDVIVARQQAMGQDRALVDVLDLDQASQFVRVVLSGSNNYTSGQVVLAVTSSNVVRIRVLNVHFQNRETSHMTVLFRDGSITGDVVAGPYIVNPLQDRTIEYEKLKGHFFLSGIYAVVISGAFSAGIETNVGYYNEDRTWLI